MKRLLFLLMCLSAIVIAPGCKNMSCDKKDDAAAQNNNDCKSCRH